MTDKEFKRLSRSQLIDIIYQLQTKDEELVEDNRRLEEALQSKRIRMENAGSIAQAALELNDVFQSAQNAAEQYLAEVQMIRTSAEKKGQQIISAAEEEADRIVRKAKEEADQIIQRAIKDASSMIAQAREVQKRAGTQERSTSASNVDALLTECRDLFSNME